MARPSPISAAMALIRSSADRVLVIGLGTEAPVLVVALTFVVPLLRPPLALGPCSSPHHVHERAALILRPAFLPAAMMSTADAVGS